MIIRVNFQLLLDSRDHRIEIDQTPICRFCVRSMFNRCRPESLGYLPCQCPHSHLVREGQQSPGAGQGVGVLDAGVLEEERLNHTGSRGPYAPTGHTSLWRPGTRTGHTRFVCCRGKWELHLKMQWEFRYGDQMASRPSYSHNGVPYTCKKNTIISKRLVVPVDSFSAQRVSNADGHFDYQDVSSTYKEQPSMHAGKTLPHWCFRLNETPPWLHVTLERWSSLHNCCRKTSPWSVRIHCRRWEHSRNYSGDQVQGQGYQTAASSPEREQDRMN